MTIKARAITRSAVARWQGGLRNGPGSLSTESGSLADRAFNFRSRFETHGCNPEELVAAAQAGCFTMTLALKLEDAELTAEWIETVAEVILGPVTDGYEISGIHLLVEADIPGCDLSTFEQLIEEAKLGSPVSKLIRTRITLESALAP